MAWLELRSVSVWLAGGKSLRTEDPGTQGVVAYYRLTSPLPETGKVGGVIRRQANGIQY